MKTGFYVLTDGCGSFIVNAKPFAEWIIFSTYPISKEEAEEKKVLFSEDEAEAIATDFSNENLKGWSLKSCYFNVNNTLVVI